MEFTNVDHFIYEHNKRRPDSHFFDKDTLRFFGERVSDMKLLKPQTITDNLGNVRDCYVLSSLQRKHPDGPTRKWTYFDKNTFAVVYPKEAA